MKNLVMLRLFNCANSQKVFINKYTINKCFQLIFIYNIIFDCYLFLTYY